MAGRGDTRSRGLARLLVVGPALALAGCSSPHVVDVPRTGRTSAASQTAPAGRPAELETGAIGVLEGWDRRRSAAYAAGSATRLHRLYVPGSRAADVDVDLLRRYLRRGFHVRGMRTQVLAVSVLGHRPGRWRVHVVDRVVGAVATGGGQRVRLPQGRAGGYVLTLVREAGIWRMASTRRTPTPVG